MRKIQLSLAALIAGALILQSPAALAQASAAQAAGRTKPSPLAPGEIVAQAPKGDWVAVAPADLLVMDLEPDAKGKPRRVVIQLMPAPFSQGLDGQHPQAGGGAVLGWAVDQPGAGQLRRAVGRRECRGQGQGAGAAGGFGSDAGE
jgi:hypothetical protein